MKEPNSTHNFPKVQIKPFDGMSITADVWSQAHEEHRHSGRAHTLFFHGSGIVNGLDVVANDPPDSYVFISPGIAVDSAGNVIELTEPVAYDFGDSAEGPLFLLLGHGEREVGGTQKEIRYNQNEFVIAARSNIPKRPSVELARITLPGAVKAIRDASNRKYPEPGELDLRFRNSIGPKTGHPIQTAVCCLGDENQDVILGWDNLNHEFERASHQRLIIDHVKDITNTLLAYDLIYLGCSGTFKVLKKTVSILSQYLEQGGVLIVEALDQAAQENCQGLLEQLHFELKPIQPGDDLLMEPFFFVSPPEGINGNHVLCDTQVIYSAAGYSLSWAGKTNQGTLARSEIRSSHEWGVNLIVHLIP